MAELGQAGEQGGGEHRADAGDGEEQAGELADGRAFELARDQLIDRTDGGIELAQEVGRGLPKLGLIELGEVAGKRVALGQEGPAVCLQLTQPGPVRIRRPDSTTELGCAAGDQGGVDAVRLGVLADSSGERPHPGRVQDADLVAGAVQGTDDLALVAAAGFKPDGRDRVGREPLDQQGSARSVIGDDESAPDRRERDVEPLLADIDADNDRRLWHHKAPWLVAAGSSSCNSEGPRNRLGATVRVGDERRTGPCSTTASLRRPAKRPPARTGGVLEHPTGAPFLPRPCQTSRRMTLGVSPAQAALAEPPSIIIR